MDFGKNLDNSLPSMGGASVYMKELVDKLSFIRKEVLSRYSIGDITQEWLVLHSRSRTFKTQQ